MEKETESLRPAPELEVRTRSTGLAAAPPGTRYLFVDNLKEADPADQGLEGFVQEDKPNVRRYIYKRFCRVPNIF